MNYQVRPDSRVSEALQGARTWDPADGPIPGQPGTASADSRVRPGPRPGTTLRPPRNQGSKPVSDTTSSSLPITRWISAIIQAKEVPGRGDDPPDPWPSPMRSRSGSPCAPPPVVSARISAAFVHAGTSTAGGQRRSQATAAAVAQSAGPSSWRGGTSGPFAGPRARAKA